MDTLQIRPVVPGTEAWDAALEIYREAFPRKERRSEADQLRALADPLFRTEGIFVDGTLRGIVFYWLFGESRYIEYLAMAPAMRGRNLGSQVLQRFCAGRRVILEIEPPEDELTVRRLHFYERAGFHADARRYIHPSYSRPFEPHRLVLMSYPSPLENDEARLFADFIRERVLAYSEHQAPTAPRLP